MQGRTAVGHAVRKQHCAAILEDRPHRRHLVEFSSWRHVRSFSCGLCLKRRLHSRQPVLLLNYPALRAISFLSTGFLTLWVRSVEENPARACKQRPESMPLWGLPFPMDDSLCVCSEATLKPSKMQCLMTVCDQGFCFAIRSVAWLMVVVSSGGGWVLWG